jgi:hypothetical protein
MRRITPEAVLATIAEDRVATLPAAVG